MTSEPSSAALSNDVAISLPAKRYAQAAFELASAANDLPAWQDALDQTAEFMADADVRRVLENSRVAPESKQRLVEAALADLPAMPLNLARLMARKGRTALAPEIAAQFRLLQEERAGVEHVRATTAVPLSDAERGALADQLRQRTGHDVVLETAVEPDILGGIVVQIGDRLIDASTRGKLAALRKSLQ